ncbi:MAG: porin family protein [Alphaproteobacteria bacterium]|nr:porin family protein [Alphaproteobacteria bacterium]
MKRSAVTCGFLASLAAAALTPGTASAQGVGDLYWGLFGGAQFYSDNEIGNADIDFDPGWAVGGQLGYIFGSVRAEAEIEYNESDVDSFGGGDNDATLSALRGTGSLYFDFVGFSQSNILPYAGAGFGIGSLEFDGDDLNDDEVGLTAHGEIGVSFAAATNFDVVFAYRFEWYDTEIEDVEDNITAHQVRAGIRFFSTGCC